MLGVSCGLCGGISYSGEDMKVIIAIAIYFMSLSTFVLASCLDEGMLKHMDKNAPEVSVLAFPQCVALNQCKIARNELEKVKNYDGVKYSFLKGCALANGDCFKQDLKEAEKLLLSCSKYSRACKINLFNLYSIYGDNPEKYEQFALDLANSNYIMAIGFLADLYANKGTLEGHAKSLFWAKLLIYAFETQLKNQERFEYENRAYIAPDVKLRKQRIAEIENVSSLLKKIEYQLPKELVNKIDRIFLKYLSQVQTEASDATPPDSLSDVMNFYGVSGRSLKGAFKKNQKINLTPPKIQKPDRIREYEESIMALLG